MQRIAKFEKVSFEQFKKDWIDTFGLDEEANIEEIYENIKLPRRATAGSAGYDFFAPVRLILEPGETLKIPTGIRVEMDPEWVLKCYPRSGLGFKYRLQLNNTVGIIDSDYFIQIMKGICSPRLQMIPMKRKPLISRREKVLCRGFLWNMESRWTMM